MAKKTNGTLRAPVIVDTGHGRSRYRLRDGDATSATVLMLIGAAFALVGVVDLGLRWIPTRLGTPGWEFVAVSETFTNLPMATVGLALLVYGLLRHPERHAVWGRVGAGVCAVVALVLIGMGFLYVTAVPAVARQASEQATEALVRAVIKNGAEILVYPAVFAMMSVILWRGVERLGK